MAINTKLYIEDNLVIKTKDSKLVNLKINEAQDIIYNTIAEEYEKGHGVRIILLKARQMGASTLVGGIIFKQTVTAFNINSSVIAHDADSTSSLFEMHKLFYEQLPPGLKPSLKANNARILEFDRDDGGGLKSSIRCMTAGTQGVGRGKTIQKLHLSEFAFWSGNKLDTFNGLMQTVPNTPDSLVIIESTANGFNEFQELWSKACKGENDFVPVFIPWFTLKEYRMKAIDFIPTTEELQLKEKYKLDNEQLAWRRWCIKNNCAGDIYKFKQEYPATAAEAFISSGTCFFDVEQITERINELDARSPVKRGYFTYHKEVDRYGQVTLSNIKWEDTESGFITIFSEPKQDARYAIGGDPAGEGSDNFIADVIDARTCEQVAQLAKEKISEDDYTEQCKCLADYYNIALAGFETNFNPYIVKLYAKIEGTRQYIKETSADSKIIKKTDKYGFKTTSASRPVILSEMRIIFNENPDVINSKATLDEMRTFISNEAGKYAAMPGKHDDRVMAYAIACEIREQALKEKKTKEARIAYY